jgi:hypothetical protein
MRFALRNKDKLIQAFGEPFYCELVECLKKYFESDTANDRCSIDGLNKEAIKVTSSTAGRIHIFAVIGQMYDVVKLAYYKTENNE